MMKLKKIFLITNIPNPYRISLFNELNEALKKYGTELKVIFGALGYPRRKWIVDMNDCEFDYKVLNSKIISLANPENALFTYTRLLNLIFREKPKLVITPGFSFATAKLWLWSWFFPVRYIIWTGSISKKGRFDSYLRRMQRKILIKRAAGFVAYGTKAREYLLSQGAAKDKISIAINTVNINFFIKGVENLKRNFIASDSKKHLLYIGYLSPRKNSVRVLRIIKKLSSSRSDIILDIVGDGEDRTSLEEYTNHHGLNDFVRFHGFKQRDEILQFMARARCFLFQTDFDIWGLVLNEAMAAGLPCIASVNAGATYDLIIEGETGFAVNFSEEDKVISRINWILDNPKNAREIGESARKFILENASLKNSSEGFIKAMHAE